MISKQWLIKLLSQLEAKLELWAYTVSIPGLIKYKLHNLKMAMRRLMSMMEVMRMYILNIVIASHDFLEQRGTFGSFRYRVLLSLQPSTLPSHRHQSQHSSKLCSWCSVHNVQCHMYTVYVGQKALAKSKTHCNFLFFYCVFINFWTNVMCL